MSNHPHVPADVDATSIIDLVEDCREVSGVLSPYLPLGTVLRLPEPRTVSLLEIDDAVAAASAVWGDY